MSETEIYSYRHKGGFPHTLLPGYVLGGQFGAVLQINLITALLMLQVFLLAYELFHSLMASFLTWICMAFSIPIVIYMGQIYPEPLAALLTIWAVRRIRMFQLPETLRERSFWKNSVILGVCLLCIVLLKTRYLPIAATLALFFSVPYDRTTHPYPSKTQNNSGGRDIGCCGHFDCSSRGYFVFRSHVSRPLDRFKISDVVLAGI